MEAVKDRGWNARSRSIYPEAGSAFIVPVSSIGGKKQFEFLTDGRGFVKGEESTLERIQSMSFLVVIANQGYTELVMDAARAAHAPGGTVIHAKGTGAEKAEKFFGVSLAKEKEVIFYGDQEGRKNAIMTSIMEKGRPGDQGQGHCIFPSCDRDGGHAADRGGSGTVKRHADREREQSAVETRRAAFYIPRFWHGGKLSESKQKGIWTGFRSHALVLSLSGSEVLSSSTRPDLKQEVHTYIF